MPTKTKTTAPKPAPKKSAAKVPPLRFAGVAALGLTCAQLHVLLNLRTSKELAGLLRERGLGIPKDKREMVSRLIGWVHQSDRLFILSIG
jgi:hypothetical protein